MNRENAFSSGKQTNPVQNASFLSKRTFWWLRDMFRHGQRKEITEETLYATLPEHSSHGLAEMFERLWAEEEQRGPGKASFARVYWRAFGPETLFWGLVFSLFETANRVAQPLLLGELVSYFTPNQDTISRRDAYLYAAGVIACSLLSVISFHPFIFYIFQLGMKFRIGASCLIYNKVLKLSKSTTAGDGLNGKIINLLSNDVGKFDIALCFVHDLWKGPMEAILLGYFIYCQIGLSGLLGMAFLLSFIPLQAWVGKKTATYRMKAAKRTDLRVRFMNEIIQGIQVIKMYTWESSFAKMIETIRRKEIQAIRGGAYVRATLISFFTVSRVSIFISLLSYTVTENVITAKKVFIVTSFYSILNDSMVHFWPMAITFCAEGYISLKRIRDFLLTPEGKLTTDSTTRAARSNVKDGMQQEKATKPGAGDADGKVTGELEKGKAAKQNGSTTLIKGEEVDSEPLLSKRFVRIVDGDRKGVVLDNATARWMCPTAASDGTTTGLSKGIGDSPEEATNVGIETVSLTIEPGRLCVLVGPVGSGKSTLLQVLLGELEVDEGSVEIYGSVSYAAQEPWLFEGSVRNNILFTEQYDERRYLRVVRVCALEKDFEQFPHGDQTIVGERGISLSGGQKARVNLARAIYRKADIYLLDDPLSAVDTHVGKHIYELCIREFLANRVCVLVTHQLQYLKDVQQIVLMNGGRVEACGSYRELKKSNIESIMALTPDESPLESPIEKELKNMRPRRTSGSSTGSQRDDLLMDLLQQEKQEEEKESQGGSGSVGMAVYKAYITAVNSCGWVFWLSVLMVLSQIVVSGVDIFVAEWVNWEERVAGIPPVFDVNDNDTILSSRDMRDVMRDQMDVSNFIDRQQYIWIYSGLIILLVILVVQRSFSFFYVCLRISINLHDQLFRGLTRATMHFFNTNPSGRILNRFSKDIGAIDSSLPMALLDCVVFLLEMIAVVAVVSIVNYWFLLPTVIVAVIMYYIRQIYLNTSRVVKRIESVNRSPLFSHTNATLQGLSTIRAFGAQSVLQREFNDFLDVNSAAWYMFIATNRAFALWLDLVCVLYIGIVTVSFLVGSSQQMLGGSVGLAITKTISLVGMCQWGMRQSAELENQMVSVERVKEYTNLPSEPPLETAPKHRPQRNWPEHGSIRFVSVDLRYSDDGERVLKDLTFTMRPNEKIGIVGRTGAGKSSLIQALFRLAPFEGNIEIDDIDTKTLGLRDLRSKISIIPQDPILFSGTLRSNLDPFDQRKDEELWSALDQVELKEAVSSLAGGLECRMSDGGSNFSMGQRQLVCLARAILRNNKILVLDEATANVDPETDKLIQTTIRTKFAHCTVLTIAHRLHTVMDSDRVLVMDAGRVVEFGHPHELLHGPIGYLRRLVDQTGVATAAMLMRTAEDNFKKSSARQTEAITLGLSGQSKRKMNPAEYDRDQKIHDLRRVTNPVGSAGTVSWYTFWWLKDLFRAGLKRPIDETDIYETLSSHQSAQLSYQFERYWRAEQRGSERPSFLRVICRIYWQSILGYGSMYTIVDLLARILQPQCLGGLVSYFAPEQKDITKEQAYYYAAGIILCSLVPVAIFHHFILYIFQIGMKIRVACCSLLYKKASVQALRITKAAGTDGMTGQVINLMSNDVAKFDTATGFVHDIWKGLIELLVLGYFIYQQIGISGLFGIAFLLSFIPLQAWLGKKAALYRLKTANRTDRRIQFMNEIIQGIQVIKMYAWEDSFSRMVDRIRRKEVNGIRGTLFIRAGLLSFNLVSRVAIFLSLVAYVLHGNAFTAKRVFIVTSYFNWLYSSMLHFWPLALTSVHEGLVSIRRIQDFLLQDEQKFGPVRAAPAADHIQETAVDESARGLLAAAGNGNGVVKATPEGRDAGSSTVGKSKSKRFINRKAVVRQGVFMRNATALWEKDLPPAAFAQSGGSEIRVSGLKNVTLTIEKAKPCVIVGSVGSGKSTILQVILGELELDEGRLEINGNLSYAPQEPWLFEGTVKNNIVFTEDYQEKRYREVVSVCALDRDFRLLPEGDQTIVGERGISLSGGQRARISLARAVYRRADIYLLDDPLSAVDTHVGKHIFEECIIKYLKEKVCVLVTHQLQYLKDIEHVVLMSMGNVEAQGPFRTLAESGRFAMLNQHAHHVLDDGEEGEPDAGHAPSPDGSSAAPSAAAGQHTGDAQDSDSGHPQSVDSVAYNGMERDSIVNIDINSKAETHRMTERRLSIHPTPAQHQPAHQQHQSLYQPSPFSSSSMVFDGYDDREERRGAKKRSTVDGGTSEKDGQNQPHKESQLTGRIGWRVYRSFFQAVESNALLALAVVLFLLAQTSMSGIDYYISQWVNWEEYSSALERLKSNRTEEFGSPGGDDGNSSDYDAILPIPPKLRGSIFIGLSRHQHILLYAVAMLFMFVLSLSRSFLFFYICLRATIRLHDRLFRGITRATMYFFNTNPSGRILNRFSRDIGCIDTFLPFAMMDCILFFVEFSAIIVLVAVVNYWLLFPTLVMAIIFYILRHVYTNTARSIKRVEAATRSPIFSHANASFQGLSTIRAFGVEKILADEFDKHQDLNTSAWYLFLATTRAFAQWLELVCVLYIAVVTLSFLMVENSMSGNVGLAITQVFNLIFMCQWGMRQTAELENQMTSVERVVEYAEVDPEPSLVSIGKHKPPTDWPAKGAIRFEHFSLRYSPKSDVVLRDLNLTIHAGEKIGIVGRTGAGKSSIIQALFRLAVNEGIIHIDSVDIGTLGLHDLRKRISIIPQDPILFSGTVRENLDPFKQHDDAALWNALEYVELKEVVRAMDGTLDGKMSDGGSNFSMGQRQLVCLARAILRNNPILILDEATANVDPDDRVLVMDAGKAVEYAHPYELLQRPDGTLKQLVNQTEPSTALQLTSIAYEGYNKRPTQGSERVDCGIGQPFLLGQLILYFDAQRRTTESYAKESDTSLGAAYGYAVGIVMTVMAPLVIFHCYQLYLLQVGMKIRIGCCALIYQKGPVELVIVAVFVYREIGPAGLIGIGFILLFIPIQAWLGKKSAAFRMSTALATDERVRLTNEIIHGIQVIKMYVWERPFEAIVSKLRWKEIRALRGSVIIKSALFALRIVPKLSIFLTLVAYVYFDNALTARRVVDWEETYANTVQASWTTDDHVLFYAGAIVITILLTANSFAFFEMCLKAALHLHAALYRGVSETAMLFFYQNPSGRVMNRFSKDIGLIDSSLPIVMVDSIYFFLELSGIIVIVALANYWLLIPTVIMGAVFYMLRFVFLRTARNVKRVEAISKHYGHPMYDASIFTHTNATIDGLTTIRAFGAERFLEDTFHRYQDLNTSAVFLFGATTRGFAFWLDVICLLYIASVVLSFLVIGNDIISGNVGLAITQVLNLIGMCNWGIRQTAELENQMTSVERVLEYAELQPELDLAPGVRTTVRSEAWPESPSITFREVSLRYTPTSEPVLKQLSFAIKAQERVGIVGRTGAGKSSIIQALFRLTPLTGERDGIIEIDGINIGSVPLRQCRDRISIIPQDPVIFSGSLRSNLDPYDRLPDEQLWKALEQVRLNI
uniref:Uncharacterized protein n=1 Tax=Anopheles dirus TaxID=7168 RepID=A0A182NN20_9DIPT